MKDATKNGRPAKREVIVIDDDESANEQPVVKKEKGDAEAILSAKVEELEKELDKWKDKYQHAVRAAGEHKGRAEKAEERLDSKFGIKEVFNAEKIRANELEKRLADVSSQLEEARRIAAGRQEVRDSQAEDRARIAELSKKLAVYEKAEQRGKEKVAAKQKPMGAPAGNFETPQTVPELHRSGHPTNILQLCSPDSSESTPFKIARKKILSLTEKLEGTKVAIGIKIHGHFLKLPTFPILRVMEIHCVACEKTVMGKSIIEHFLGSKHQRKCNALGAAVSSAALEYWVDKLQLKTDAAADAASPKVVVARQPRLY